MTHAYEKRNGANWVDFLEQVEAWVPQEVSRVYAILDNLNTAHDQLDLVLDTIGSAIDQADAEANRQPREQRPAIH